MSVAVPPAHADVADREFWDGSRQAYIAGHELVVPPSLRLSSDFDDDIDPVTFAVVRHGLWAANDEHTKVIERVSVSPIAVEVRDFQTSILTENAELLCFGPCLQFMSGALDLTVKYLIERRGAKLREGDMWLCNDPVIGTTHQSDVCLMAPVYVDGEVFCWVANTIHQNDLGGTAPGSFCPNARDVYWDPVCIPPIRIVADGEVDGDMEEVYRRASRTPDNLSVDLRAGVAGNHTAMRRIEALVERYGKRVVKGVMRRALDASEAAFVRILETVPDGKWSERLFQEVALTGDGGTYPVQTNITKRDDTLVVDNEGTHAQVGAINVGYGGWRGAVLAAVNVLMLPEQMGCVGGALRHIRFAPVPATITCPDREAAVSPAGMFAIQPALSVASGAVSRLLLCSSEDSVRDRAISPSAAPWGAHIHAGTNQRGEFYVGGHADSMIGAGNATWRRDGEAAGGHYWLPENRGPNVEAYERDWPILYLYRREQVDSGGAGRRRAGNGGEIAYVAHRGTAVLVAYSTERLPKTTGLLGGAFGSRTATRLVRESNVRSLFASGRMPASLDEIEGREDVLENKGPEIEVDGADVLVWNWTSPGGYGDPMTRDPEDVRADVESGAVSAGAAREVYGVALRDDGAVDRAATAALRSDVLTARVEGDPLDAVAGSGGYDHTVADILGLRDGWFHCLRCHTLLGEAARPWRAGLRVVEEGLEVPHASPPLVSRAYSCPGCGVHLASEVARPDEPPFDDIRLGDLES